VVALTDVELADDDRGSPTSKSGGVRPALAAAQADSDAAAAPPPGLPEADGVARRAPGALAPLPDPAERAHAHAGRSKSDATIRAYASGWRDFLSFCDELGADALPASDQTVAAYLAHLADRQAKAATIARFACTRETGRQDHHRRDGGQVRAVELTASRGWR
jgi:hypothetical protein